MSVKVRFAPSPTGYLHVGNIRTALVNWLFARKTGGEFWLRIDDTDTERSKSEYEDAIREDMAWLGMDWDKDFRQSTRKLHYTAAIEKLKNEGRLYACYETPDELDIQRKMQASRGLPPVYNRASLKLTDEQKQAFAAEGRTPHWRFLLNEADIIWDDLVRGTVKLNPAHMSDPVLIRADGVPLYTLASVVDDGEMGITHIVRGEDHVSNTAVQTQLYEALGFELPTFAHLALIKTKEGELSKRSGGSDIRSMRASGILPMAINSLLASLGTSQDVEPVIDLQTLIDRFDFGKFGRAPANFDPEDLGRLNEKLIHQTEWDDIKDRFPNYTEEFWYAIRANLTKLDDTHDWWQLLHGTVDADLTEEDRQFTAHAATLLPAEPWDESTYKQWIDAVKTISGRKGKPLFMPIRKALTGQEHGPELGPILLLLGKEKAEQRLTSA